jgi:hypothetical protein
VVQPKEEVVEETDVESATQEEEGEEEWLNKWFAMNATRMNKVKLKKPIHNK